MKLSSEQYVGMSGVRCPTCLSDDIEGGSVAIDMGMAEQRVSCNTCGSTWFDIYTLDGYTELTYAPGCDQVEVTASLDANGESALNLEAARRYAHVLYSASEVYDAMRSILAATNINEVADQIAKARSIMARIESTNEG